MFIASHFGRSRPITQNDGSSDRTVPLRKRTVTKPSSPSGAGRKPLLTPEVQAEFFGARALGLSVKRSAELAGVSETSITNWRTRGKAVKRVPANKRNAMDVKCLDFLRALEKIDSEWIRRCEIVLSLSMAPGQSRKAWEESTQDERREATATAKWKLSHQAPSDNAGQDRDHGCRQRTCRPGSNQRRGRVQGVI